MRNGRFPVVCIGMSAGGVAPLQALFRALSPKTGMAFVVIHHLRQYPTQLPAIISSCTSMPVQLAGPGVSIQPDHVYVLPSGQEISLTDGAFALQPRRKLRGWANVVRVFLDSLTESGHGGIAVILSGMDSDGAEALKNFKLHGGITIAQAPDTASSREMPVAAIKTGAVDYILEPVAISDQLERIAQEREVSLPRAIRDFA